MRRLRGHVKQIRYGAGKVLGNPIWTPGVSADGRLLATGSKDGEVRFWSLPDGRPRGAPLRFRYGNADLQLSPDGRLLSALPSSRDDVTARVEIWDVRDRRRVATLQPAAAGSAARWSPDGRRLAVSDARGRVQVYSTATWKPVTPALAGGRAAWMTFSPDGRTLAAGNTDGTVSLWDARSGQALGARLPGIPQSTPAPFFTPGSRYVIAAQDNGRAVRWDIRPASLAKHACDVAGRRLSRAEWEEFLPGRDVRAGVLTGSAPGVRGGIVASASSSKRSWLTSGSAVQQVLEQREAGPVVVELVGRLRPHRRRPVARERHPQLAHLGDLVGRVDGERVAARVHHRRAQPRLALRVGAAARRLRHRADERGDAGSEALLELERRRVRVLEAVMEHPGGDHVVGVAAAAQELRDLERVQDEGGVVGLPPLAVVVLGRELERVPGHRQLVDEARKLRHGGEITTPRAPSAASGASARRRRGP